MPHTRGLPACAALASRARDSCSRRDAWRLPPTDVIRALLADPISRNGVGVVVGVIEPAGPWNFTLMAEPNPYEAYTSEQLYQFLSSYELTRARQAPANATSLRTPLTSG